MSLRLLTGKWKGMTLASVKSASTRPTTSMLRQAIFNIWSDRIEGARFLDLFAGTGAVGFEALSLGASFVSWVESHPLAAKGLMQNIEKFGCQANCKLWSVQAEVFLKRSTSPYELIFVDPPYDWKMKAADGSKGQSGHYVMALAQALIDHLAPQGELMIEQDGHLKEQVSSLGALNYLESRSYGDSKLHRFVKEA